MFVGLSVLGWGQVCPMQLALPEVIPGVADNLEELVVGVDDAAVGGPIKGAEHVRVEEDAEASFTFALGRNVAARADEFEYRAVGLDDRDTACEDVDPTPIVAAEAVLGLVKGFCGA